jgi:cation diffusion facilitator CzcD-associated flavoprotein CzcO
MYTLGYSFRPWTDKAIADGRTSWPTCARPRRATASTARSASTTREARLAWSSDDARWTVEVSTATRRVDPLPAWASCSVQRLLPLRPGYTPRFDGHAETSAGQLRPPAALARGPRLRRQARGGHRQRRHRRDAGAVHGQDRRARDHAAALAHLRGTDEIDTFTEHGLRLRSGAELPADIIVTATGLNLLLFGGIRLVVDDVEVPVSERRAYKGLMLEGVPNFAFALGYTNASWTLKADLTGEYVCRLLRHMDAGGHRQCVPVDDDRGDEDRPLLDFSAGYVLRSLASLPKQGSRAPWRLRMNYPADLLSLRLGPVTDEAMRFTSPAPAARARASVAGEAA